MSLPRDRRALLNVVKPFDCVLFACMLGSVGCGATISQPTDPHGQIAEIVKKEDAKHGYFGHLAPEVTDASQLEEEAEAKPARDAVVDNLGATKDLKLFPLSYVRTADSQICFHKRLAIGTAEEREAEAKKIGDQWSFVARTHQTLDEVAPGSPWPAPASSTTSYKAEDRVLEICTPAPEITSATRFLTVAAVSKEHAYNNFILIWDFTGKRKE